MADDICGATAKSTGEPCQRPAGWGTPNAEGRCKFHGGNTPTKDENPNVGAPEGNARNLRHGALADPVNLYVHLDDDERAWVDKLVSGYLEEAPFGEDSPKAERLQMTCTVMYQEWAAREVVLREGPSEDTVVGVSEGGQPIVRTEEHHLTPTASTHNQTVRMNLKDLGLLDDPGSQQAESMRSIAEILSEESEGE